MRLSAFRDLFEHSDAGRWHPMHVSPSLSSYVISLLERRTSSLPVSMYCNLCWSVPYLRKLLTLQTNPDLGIEIVRLIFVLSCGLFCKCSVRLEGSCCHQSCIHSRLLYYDCLTIVHKYVIALEVAQRLGGLLLVSVI